MAALKISLCITVLNETSNIENLIHSILNQTLKPHEIIIVDAGSTDGTLNKLKRFKTIKVIKAKGCTRSEGRNIAIKHAKNKIIAITDAGCSLDKNWVNEISMPFRRNRVDAVAGFYKIATNSLFQKAASIYLGAIPNSVDKNFMPSARSMAFTKDIWNKVGGFPEELVGAGEDTKFNYLLVKIGARFKVARKAFVTWNTPNNLIEFSKKIYAYSKGDAESGIWWDPVKKLKTHNLKIISVYMRYILLSIILVVNIKLFLICFCLYFAYAFLKAKYWGVILQLVSDFSVMIGFLDGYLNFLETD